MRNFLATFCSFLLLTVSSGAFADGKAAAEKQVKDAIEHTKKVGKDTAIADINKGKFRDGELYVTVYDMEGKCLAHPVKAAQVGQNLTEQKDADGVFFVKERVKIAKEKGKGWQTYKWQNPVSKKLELKEVYIEAHDGLIFAAGAYEKK